MLRNEEFKQPKMPFSRHLSELKWRLQIALVAFVASSIFSYLQVEKIYNFLVLPLTDIYADEQTHKLIFTGLSEAFFMYLRLSLFTGFLISFPVIAWQTYSFMAPGLYKKEKKALLPYLLISPFLFLLGAALSYFYVIPLAWKFFVSFEQPVGVLPIVLEARISEYLSLVISLIVGFGLAFQLPLILIMLTHLGILQASWLSRFRRHSIVVIFIAAAILTPPDVISQVALAVPLLLLYEISVLICKKIESNRVK
jgi:sec-independent protein translocase protein TatC